MKKEHFYETQKKDYAEKVIGDIKNKFDIDWKLVEWMELNKPLMSGLAARLKLHQIESKTEIPWKLQDQAALWKKDYTTKTDANTNEFIEVINKFEEGTS